MLLSEGLHEEQVHGGPKLHATLRFMTESVCDDGQILPIQGVKKALEDDSLILFPNLRVLGATLPLHPLEESEGLIDVNYVDLIEMMPFVYLLTNVIDDLFGDPLNIGELRDARGDDGQLLVA